MGRTSAGPVTTKTRRARTSMVRPRLFRAAFTWFNLWTVNAIDDWCIFAPPTPGPDAVIGNTERIEVAWCIKPGHGTRLIPDGAITGAHFVQTPDYVQVTGVGDLTKINIPQNDAGGELDPHGADGNGTSAALFELILALWMRPMRR